MNVPVIQRIQNDNMARQRNFFIGCLLLMLIANFLLSAKLYLVSEKIVMVPGIARQYEIDGEEVSGSYLEEAALLYISALLDLTPTTVEDKKEMILRNVSRRSPDSLKSLQEYFADAIEQHKKFQLVTTFSPKKLYVNTRSRQVIADGILTTVFGKRAHEEKQVKYKISFDFEGGRLFLKGFAEIAGEESRETDKTRRGHDEI
jgi:conjugal transfer pilus assembly protein TraE